MFGYSFIHADELKKLRKENEELRKYEEIAKKYAAFEWRRRSFEEWKFDADITIETLLIKYKIMESLAKRFSPTIREDVDKIFDELKK